MVVDGDHEWREPNFANGAQRGPCPGLNALANHGYINRDGVAGLLSVVPAINEVYGMDVGLATLLSVMGTVWTGDPLSLTPGFSLDGYHPKVANLLGNLLGLLGKPRGIGKSHNWLESDASLTRDDLYMTGDASTMNMNRFQKLYDRADESGVISEADIVEHSIDALQECIATNPYCWYGPYTGTIARNAGVAFAVRLLSNHSIEHPRGVMTQDIFKSFWGVIEDEAGQLEYKRGWERIPENWYKTPVDYTLIELNLDLVSWIARWPVLASIGGNVGSVNSFTVLNLTDVSSGLMNVPKLLEDNNLLCFILSIVKTVSPDSLSGIFATLAKPLQLLTDVLGTSLTDLSCPPAADMQYGGEPIWDSLLNTYPGAGRAGSCL